MTKFCSRYGLYELKFIAELLLVEVYLAIGDIGQSMVLLSQTLASLEQYPNQFVHVRVAARLILAQIKFKRGETLFAYEELVHDVLPYALEHGTKKLYHKNCFVNKLYSQGWNFGHRFEISKNGI